MHKMRYLLLKLIAGNFSIVSFGTIYYLIALYMGSYGINDPRTIGWILAAYYAVSMLSRPFVGWIVEKLSFRTTLIAASCACVASGAGLALSGVAVPFILFFRATAGFSSSLFLVGLMVYQTLSVPEEVRGSSFTLVTVGTIAPLVIVVPLAEWLLKTGRLKLYIWFPVIPALLCLLVATMLPRYEETIKMHRNWGSYKEVFANPALRALLPSVILFSVTDAAIISFAGLALEKKLIASFFISSQAFTAVLIRLFGFRLMDVMPRSRLAALSFLVTSGSLFVATFAKSNAALVAWGIAYGVAMGYGFPLHLSLIGDAVSERLRPKATSLVWFFMAACYFVSPIITGYLATRFSFAIAYKIIMGCIIATAPIIHRHLSRRFQEHLS